ncbi:BED zinc finger and hAT dimerization domain-containing protein [Rhynchospora pubera]|uniref:BED zinc finger and hAT dimerization domain-containing protein n=1 Tax=Rhynchospora pubera TaxID=906938 RepID=A0AAV8FR79_9POAL|nr:BED zinc finger and hAT dimerization domain-containing protein [Rhynchospora pubera]KAJ4794259.1 BED zinc finger and hAT dimerization domain-containing protein [Rhynchospora pubera]
MEPRSLIDMTLVSGAIEPSVNAAIAASSDNNANNNAVPAQAVKRKKAMTSLYLKYFQTASDGKTRSCKFCKQSYSIATATGNLGRHLNNRHPGYDQIGAEVGPNTTIANAASGRSQSHTHSISKPQSPIQAKPQIDLDLVNWFLLKFLINACLPFSTLEDECFINSYKFLDPTAKIWPRKQAETVMLQVFQTMQEDIRALLQNVSSKISLTLDFWTSCEELLYMSVTSHWIDDTWHMHKVLLDICHIAYPCSGPKILYALTQVISSFDLDARIVSCTTNNSQQAGHACQLLMEQMDSQKRPLFYIPCGAHALKMILEGGLVHLKPILSKIREFVIEMNSNCDVLEDFKQMVALYQEGPLKFPIDTSATWNGDFTMLNLVRKAPNAVDNTMKKHEETIPGCSLTLSPSEYSAINILHQFLDQFYKTTTNLCTTKVRTVGLVLFFIDHIVELITSCRDECCQDWFKTLADDMCDRARGFTGQVYNGFTFMCAILDPMIKRELVPDVLNSDKNLEEARGYYVREYTKNNHFMVIPSNGFVGAHESGCSSGIENTDAVSFAEEIARKRRRSSISLTKDELSQYLAEPPAPMTTDALDWWRANSARFPRLSIMARDLLAVQSTSVEPDELFTSRGEDLLKRRYCLPFADVRPILCVNSWMQSGYRFRLGSAEIDFDRLVEVGVGRRG